MSNNSSSIRLNPDNEAEILKSLFDKFDEDLNNPYNEFFYLISKKWLNKWKIYTHFEEVIIRDQIEEEEEDVKFCPNEIINEDLLTMEINNVFKYRDINDIGNLYVKEGIILGIDYELISRQIWDHFMDWYPGIELKRPAYYSNDGKRKVEVYLNKLKIVFINCKVIELIDNYSIDHFKEYTLQASFLTSIHELKINIVEGLNAYDQLRNVFAYEDLVVKKLRYCHENFVNIESKDIRLWKLDSCTNPIKFFKKVQEFCKSNKVGDLTNILFEGELLENSLSDNIGQLQSQYIFFEIKSPNGNWNLMGNDAYSMCSNCARISDLKFNCICNEASYCSNKCKASDYHIHMMICSKKVKSDPIEGSNSKYGKCGLKNIGNTCYMNSSLQCLGHIQDLTEYFLTDKYLDDINKVNVLGNKGKFASKYASLLKKLWYGDKEFITPLDFKRTIGKLNSIFEGYQQHDSQEFLSFLIEKLHEDLNKVKKKPFIVPLEINKDDDYEIGRLSWINHLKQDNSLIVELMNGQYKSKIACPNCNKTSITFDPFFLITIPVPIKEKHRITNGSNNQMKISNTQGKSGALINDSIEVIFVPADFGNNISTKLKIDVNNETLSMKLADYKVKLAKNINKEPKNIFFSFINFFQSESIQNDSIITIEELYYQSKLKPKLFAIEISNKDICIEPNQRILVDIQINSIIQFDFQQKIALSHANPIFISKTYTFKQVHLKIFEHFKFLFDDNARLKMLPSWSEYTLEQAFTELFSNSNKKPYTVNIQTNTRGIEKCYFCDNSLCENCELLIDDEKTIEANLIPKYFKDPSYNLGFEIIWSNLGDIHPVGNINHVVICKGLMNIKEQQENANTQQDVIFGSIPSSTTISVNKDKSINLAIIDGNVPRTQDANRLISNKKMKSPEGNLDSGMNIELEDIDLLECFKRFEEPEILGNHNEWYCIQCRMNQKAMKEWEIYKTSRILIIHIKRYKNNYEKIKNKVIFPITNLDLTAYVKNHELPMEYNLNAINGISKHPNANSRVIYDLIAVSNHLGETLTSGHYTAYCKNYKTSKWYLFDDHLITEVNEDDVCTQNAYVLFYKRRANDQLFHQKFSFLKVVINP